MTATLIRVIEIVASVTGISTAALTRRSAIDQDVKITGDDVFELQRALANEFGDQVWQWPWPRFAKLGEGLGLFAVLRLFWCVLAWPFRRRRLDPPPLERLELGHIATVIDRGEWFEP